MIGRQHHGLPALEQLILLAAQLSTNCESPSMRKEAAAEVDRIGRISINEGGPTCIQLGAIARVAIRQMLYVDETTRPHLAQALGRISTAMRNEQIAGGFDTRPFYLKEKDNG